MREGRPTCFSVKLPSGETVRVRAGNPPDVQVLEALEELMTAALAEWRRQRPEPIYGVVRDLRGPAPP